MSNYQTIAFILFYILTIAFFIWVAYLAIKK